ncbi:DUF2380 domain-containing protein [Myxococcus sp. AM001]|uniref:DUF2380 domain-containing protein n=1 Tax=Myxococcus vastator TaxID=2709664 RepID=UPI0013CF4142|nr:DUF2380 domain-containing protein [Myxococcus vastator]NVJ10104.1 DUF2380 domain-containing protein [Myxococcus sp. AM001]
MRADALLLAVVLASGCASVPDAPGRSGTLSYTPRGATSPERADALSDERPRASGAPSYPIAGSGAEQRLFRHVKPRGDATKAAPGTASGAVGGRGPQAASARQALLESIDEVKGSLKEAESMLSKLAGHAPVFSGRAVSGGAFTRYLDHGSRQVAWIRGALGSATELAGVASEVGDSEMELGLFRMAGPRLQSAMFGALLFTTWVDFLQLSDVLLRECPMCGDEKLFMDLHRVQGLMEPTLADLTSRDTERVEAAALAMPALMGKLAREFNMMHADARSAMETGGKVMVAVQMLEMLTMISTLKLGTPRPPPSAPAALGVGLVMSSGGVMAGSQLVVSAEWMEMMRRLVQAGVISLPVVSAAVRIHGGQVMMAQAHQDLPEGVREALGDSPEVRGMRVTGKAGAGMSEAPKHHVLPKEHREWFEARGFKGDMDIDQFCVRLEQAHHEAIHGGGNWKLGRMWPDEWSRRIMRALQDAEVSAGRPLTRNAILKIVGKNMKAYDIPMNFTPGRSR